MTQDMTQDNILKKLSQIQTVANEIIESKYDEEKKYDMIFSEKISTQVFSLFRQTPIRFDYYDPDTSYFEDYMAFINALNYHIYQLANLSSSEDLGDNLYDRYLSL